MLDDIDNAPVWSGAVRRISIGLRRPVRRLWNAVIRLPLQRVVIQPAWNLESLYGRSDVRKTRSPIISPRLRMDEQLDVLLGKDLAKERRTNLRSRREAMRRAVLIELRQCFQLLARPVCCFRPDQRVLVGAEDLL